MRALWQSLDDSASGGVYPCFPDPELDDSATAYYGSNYPRLVDVKRRYDPDQIFRFEQCVAT